MQNRKILKHRRDVGAAGNHPGFTLLELLVVVAVIAILAVLAAVSFQDARLRSRVAQSREHQRLLALALEAYRTDRNHYPYMGDFLVGWAAGITTPVAYLTSSDAARDPFLRSGALHNGVKLYYLYQNLQEDPLMDRLSAMNPPLPRDAMRRIYGAWVLNGFSPGFDETNLGMTVPLDPDGQLPSYDPSNGTKSFGPIRRSQKAV